MVICECKCVPQTANAMEDGCENMIEVSPVLIFRGDCEAAFEYYKSVFGGEYQFLYRYKDAATNNIPAGCEEKILHVSLPLMKNVNLMGMDDMSCPSRDGTGGAVAIGIRLNDEEETFRLFEALSSGGKVIAPLKQAFYADYFGTVIDRFGISWSFNCNLGRESLV